MAKFKGRQFLNKRELTLQNCLAQLNPLLDIPTFGSSNSAANKDIMSKISTNGDRVI